MINKEEILHFIEKLEKIIQKTNNLELRCMTELKQFEQEILDYVKTEYPTIYLEPNYIYYTFSKEYQKKFLEIHKRIEKYLTKIIDYLQENENNYFTELQISIIANMIKKNINESFENTNIDDIINIEINAILIRNSNGNLKFAKNTLKIRKEIYEIVKKHCTNIKQRINAILQQDITSLLDFKLKEEIAPQIKPKKKLFPQVMKYGFLVSSLVISTYIIYDNYSFYKDTEKAKEILSNVATKIDLNKTNISVAGAEKQKTTMEKLKELNSDSVGYLKVPGTNVNHSVVQTKDNDYYLDHDFEKDYNANGWVFLDYRNSPKFEDRNNIIYGHNVYSMFSTLANTQTEEWFSNKNNHYITLITEEGETVWQVFSVYKIEVEDYYITTQFNSDQEFETFLQKIKNRSFFDFSTDVNVQDKILTLSTCNKSIKNGRTVVHAKRIK